MVGFTKEKVLEKRERIRCLYNRLQKIKRLTPLSLFAFFSNKQKRVFFSKRMNYLTDNFFREFKAFESESPELHTVNLCLKCTPAATI